MKRLILKSEAEWLAIRKKYITASNAGTILGLNPWSSPAKIRNPDGFAGNAATKTGQLLEYAVLKVTNEILHTSFKLFETEEGKPFYINDILGATPDAGNEEFLVECKTMKPEKFFLIEEPPLHYIAQLQVQLYCTGLEKGYLSILSTNLTPTSQEVNWPIQIWNVTKSDNFCNLLVKESQRFLEDETFRVDSKKKKKAIMLLQNNYEKIYG